ncbi:GTP pyrophosphokinase [Pseudomonas fluorescens]
MSDIISQYKEVKPKFERLRKNIASVLEQIIHEKKIPTFAIESRLKDEESLSSKVMRKSYTSPLDEIDDLCGIRVICYYQEDISNICSIIEQEFEILQKENKKDSLDDNQFGYSSYHYVVKLKENWLNHPNARGLNNLRAEIQIRTMLMHTWSAISHKLLYKREADVPYQFKRQLNRLSALIELADEQFDSIKNIKTQYIEELSHSNTGTTDDTSLSSDSLIAIQQRYFNNRNYQDGEIPGLVDEIRFAGFNLKQFIVNLERCLPILADMEKEESVQAEMELPLWSFAGAIRTILDLTSDDYYSHRGAAYPEDESSIITNKYRKILRSM